MRIFNLILLLVLIHTEFASAEEYIKCRVSGNTATAYYCNINGGGAASGKVDIDIFNERGSRIKSSFCVGSVAVVNGCRALCSISAPKNASDCQADVN